MNIEYRQLAAHETERMKEINPARFIKRAWRNVNGTMQWLEINWLDEEYPDGYENHYAGLKATFESGGVAIGAFKVYPQEGGRPEEACSQSEHTEDGRMVGFVSVNRDVFGNRFKYVLLDQLFVDNKCQGQGIGKALFRLAVEKAKEWGVDKLYICAGSSEDTLWFYKSLGCVPAEEINQVLAASDVNDLQLEYIVV